jgi:hypothetical protein
MRPPQVAALRALPGVTQMVSLRETAAKKAAAVSSRRRRDAACHGSTFLFQSCKIAFRFRKTQDLQKKRVEKAMRCYLLLFTIQFIYCCFPLLIINF